MSQPNETIPQLGNIYWLKSESEYPHPHVVIEITGDKATLCQITTNQNKISIPGNVIIEAGEGNLEKQSIVEVSKTQVIEIVKLEKHIGQLEQHRIVEIRKGINFIEKSFF